MKRVVCVDSGDASTINVGPPPSVIFDGRISVMWKTELPEKKGEDLAAGVETFGTHSPGGSVFIQWSIPPGDQVPLHRTPTVDYLALLSGKATLIAADGTEANLEVGDFVVLANSLHAWSNPGDEPAIFAAVIRGV